MIDSKRFGGYDMRHETTVGIFSMTRSSQSYEIEGRKSATSRRREESMLAVIMCMLSLTSLARMGKWGCEGPFDAVWQWFVM